MVMPRLIVAYRKACNASRKAVLLIRGAGAIARHTGKPTQSAASV